MTGFRVVNDNNRKLTPRETGLPPINVANFTGSYAGSTNGLGDRDGGNGFDFNNQHQFNDNVTITHGPHNLKMGFDFTRVMLFRGAANVARGDINFTDNVGGNAFASFLLGVPETSDTPEGLPLTESRQNRYAGYFMDDWKATRKLTLNLGVRYEYNSVATDITGLWRSLDLRNTEQGLPVLRPLIRTPFHFYEPEKKLFMPRLGIAFRATEKWVVRAGYGIYYNVHQLNNYTILNLNPPLSGSSAFANTATNGVLTPGRTPITFAQPFGAVNATGPTNANALNPDDFQPRVNQWSFDIQRQLPFSLRADGRLRGQQGHARGQHGGVEQPRPGPEFPAHYAAAAPAVPGHRRRSGRSRPHRDPHPLARFRRQLLVPRVAGELDEALQPRPAIQRGLHVQQGAGGRLRAQRGRGVRQQRVIPGPAQPRRRQGALRLRRHAQRGDQLDLRDPHPGGIPQGSGPRRLGRLADQRHLDHPLRASRSWCSRTTR